MNKKNIWAFVLIGLGVWILIGHFGSGIGSLMSWIVPIVLIGLGYYGIKNKRSFFGWLLLIIGLIGLVGKFSGIIGIIIAVCMIGYGISMLKRRNKVY